MKLHLTSLCTVFKQSALAAAAAPNSNAFERCAVNFSADWGWSSSWTRLLTCPSLCSSGLRSRRKLWKLRSCSSSTLECPVIGPWWCRARCGATTDDGETLLLVLFARNSGHYFLSPFLTVTLRSVYASVLEAFGRISQHFSMRSVHCAVMDLVLACPSWCNDRCFVPDSDENCSAVAVHLRWAGDAMN